MRNLDMARDYLRRALRCFSEAERALSEEDAPMAVRRSQEALEMGVKALLRLLGIEYPRSHDVSDVLLDNRERMPESVGSVLEDLAQLVSELAAVRGPAFYGYEREGIPASQAFTQDYASDVVKKVRRYLEIIADAMKPYIEGT